MKLFDRFEIVDGYPALYLPDQNAVAIADLHLGIESVMAKNGAYLPRFQFDRLIEDFDAILDATAATTLIINGDMKNAFSKTERGEWQEVKAFIDHALERVEEVVIVKGNHDNYLIYVVQDYEAVSLQDRFVLEDTCFLHGHELPEGEALDADYLVIGHEHPSLALQDDSGVTEKIPCFLYGDTREGQHLVVLPAFSHLADGTPINRSREHDLLSPILQECVDLDALQAVGVDPKAGTLPFTSIGKLRHA